MRQTIGLDMGISATKAVLVVDGEIKKQLVLKPCDTAEDAVKVVENLDTVVLTDVYGRPEKGEPLTAENTVVVATGIRNCLLGDTLKGIAVKKVDEFIANSKGAAAVTGQKKFLVASLGSGVSLVMNDEQGCHYHGGNAVGGGTLTGLCRMILGTDDIDAVGKMALGGTLRTVDQLISDLTPEPLPGLPVDVTATALTKMNLGNKKEDIACGLINMVLRNAGQTVAMSLIGSDVKNVVVIGGLSTLPQAKWMFDAIGRLYGLYFHLPENPRYITAYGAALSF